MKLEDQVTSLEISKKLKELGVKQDSLFYWINNEDWSDEIKLIYISNIEFPRDENSISAFTASELMEILGESVNVMKWKGYGVKSPNEWDKYVRTNNLVESLGMMLIYLIENNKLSQVKK